MSGLFHAIDVSATGLSLQRRKMDVVAENIANAETTRTPKGGPYRRKRMVVSEVSDKVPFKNELVRARTGLARTNPQHRYGKLRISSPRLELAKVDGREHEAPKESYRLVHDPDHPDADEQGFVRMPDIEIVTEMVDMMTASRAYEANTMAIAAAKDMARRALEI
jgi:flagellar basal-body rod protein FlgC